MARERKQWSTSTDFELYTKLKRLSVITRIASSKLLDEAIKDLLNKHDFEKLNSEYTEEP